MPSIAEVFVVLPSVPVETTSSLVALGTVRHQMFYKALFRPAVMRADRLAGRDILPPKFKFHGLRHTYTSLCAAAGIPPLQISRFMGHAKVTTTLAIYTHLFADDHTETMAALEAMSRPVTPNVVPIRRRG